MKQLKINEEAENFYDLLSDDEEERVAELFGRKSVDFRDEVAKTMNKACQELKDVVSEAFYDFKEELQGYYLYSSLRSALVSFMLDEYPGKKSIFIDFQAKKLRAKILEEHKEVVLKEIEKDLLERVEQAEAEAKKYKELYYNTSSLDY